MTRSVWLLVLPFSLVQSCDPRVTTIGVADTDAGSGQFIEAETGTLTGPFAVGTSSEASGGRFIYAAAGTASEDAPGPARAAYQFTLAAAGSYQIWGRVHNQTIEKNRFWFQVDGDPWVKWQISTGDIWYWDAFHDGVMYGVAIKLDLSAGAHELVIANCVDDAQLDRLYISSDPTRPEPKGTACNPPHSVDLDGGCAPSCGSLAGKCQRCAAATPTYDCPACCPPTP
ncbi:MAG TPA: hypothetical protein VGL19_13445 [Polyangiaceae bacterium]|jgi:hypothetical protein